MGQALSVDDFVLQTACEAREHRLQSQLKTKRKRNRRKAKGKSSYVRREEHVRSCLEVLTRSSWPSTRKLHWLVGENGRHLELDCYSHRHACAVEVQGEHHYKYSPFYHKTRAQFEKYRRNDLLKAAMCQARGVLLLYVPPRSVCSDADIPAFVVDLLQKNRALERKPLDIRLVKS